MVVLATGTLLRVHGVDYATLRQAVATRNAALAAQVKKSIKIETVQLGGTSVACATSGVLFGAATVVTVSKDLGLMSVWAVRGSATSCRARISLRAMGELAPVVKVELTSGMLISLHDDGTMSLWDTETYEKFYFLY